VPVHKGVCGAHRRYFGSATDSVKCLVPAVRVVGEPFWPGFGPLAA